VLYPHFAKAVVPGWLDRISGATAPSFLDRMIVLRRIRNRCRRCRTRSCRTHRLHALRHRPAGAHPTGRRRRRQKTRLADEFAEWLEQPGTLQVEAL
jgi:hypothetical protein